MDDKESNTENTKYLYGAAVQGIQEFIFQTNKLIEIVGASELVDKICTTAFQEFGGNGEQVVMAAGNIKHIFTERKECEKAVKNFPRKVMNMAPGITISQAVVTLRADEHDYAMQSDELEKRLRAQRNRASRSMTMGLMGIKRAPATGLPAVDVDKEREWVDDASNKKQAHTKRKDDATFRLARKAFDCEVFKVSHENIAYDIDKIAGENSWIAVIHADGNGLGKIVREIGQDKGLMKKFSGSLDEMTKLSAKAAFSVVMDVCKDSKDGKWIIPIRPVILGGDDFTVICRADFAVEYTQAFLKAFEEETKKMGELTGSKSACLQAGLTACAGIAFVKSSYPFHYAIHLAESLCKRAKRVSKNLAKDKGVDLAPSCLMFHKVQDSFIEDFAKIAERELKTNGLKLEFGPYYLHPQEKKWSIQMLLDNTKLLDGKAGNAVKSHLREWLGLLFDNPLAADQKMKRLLLYNETVNNKEKQHIIKELELKEFTEVEKVGRIPFYDMLSLLSIKK